MSSPPPPYDDITGISRAVMKDNAQESLVNYNGNARPGELVVNLVVDPPTLWIGNNLGQLTAISSGGGSSTWATLGDKNNAAGPTEIALGQYAGDAQGTNSIAIGINAGNTTQGTESVAIGDGAGKLTQGDYAIAVGYNAGNDTQDQYAIAIGIYAGEVNQGLESVAIGSNAGTSNQGANTVATGSFAGATDQGSNAVAVGSRAASANQGANAVAIGNFAGQNTQGNNAIAIGAYAANTSQATNSIVFNATGVALQNTTANTLVMKPVRQVTSTNAWSNPANTLPTGFFFTAYNPTTGELIYWS